MKITCIHQDKSECFINSVLIGQKAKFIKSALKRLNLKDFEGERLAILDTEKSVISISDNCPHRHSLLGITYYCDRKETIDEFIEKHKDKIF